MYNRIILPPELESVVGTESVDFTALSKRKKPLKDSLGLVFFGIFWTAFTSIFVVAFFGPLFKGEEVSFSANGEMVTASLENMEPLLVPALLIGFFVLVGIGLLLGGIFSLLQKGGYFVGTASRLLHYRKGNISTYDWEQFSGNMKMNARKGNITLELRSGKMVGKGRGHFVHDIVYISGAPNVLDIEKMCRKRIKENDPTPARN